jgi:hypothetical protein
MKRYDIFKQTSIYFPVPLKAARVTHISVVTSRVAMTPENDLTDIQQDNLNLHQKNAYLWQMNLL